MFVDWYRAGPIIHPKMHACLCKRFSNDPNFLFTDEKKYIGIYLKIWRIFLVSFLKSINNPYSRGIQKKKAERQTILFYNFQPMIVTPSM